MGAMDELNRRFGRGAVAIACVRQERHGGAPRQERRSPRFTTRAHEFVTVRALRGLRRLIKHKDTPADDALIAAVAPR